jgi:hypothetical protein
MKLLRWNPVAGTRSLQFVYATGTLKRDAVRPTVATVEFVDDAAVAHAREAMRFAGRVESLLREVARQEAADA